MRALMLFILLACSLNAALAKEFSAKVIAVFDGDTVLIKRAGSLIKIRLAEIDAPEVDHTGMGVQPPNPQNAQAFGDASRRSLSDMVLGQQVQVNSQTTDKYGRMVAHLGIDGLDVNAEQIRRGMAWEYSNFHSNKALIALQAEARQAQRGLWAQNNPLPPWTWRKQHPSTLSAPTSPAAPPVPVIAASPAPLCGSKKHCSEMSSCDEVRHYFAVCGVAKLDGDKDNIPCEKLCSPKKP